MPAFNNSCTSCQRLACRRPGRVRVGQFVDENHGGTAGEGGIEVEFVEHGTSVLHRAAGQDLETRKQGFSFRSPVSLDDADDDVHSIATLLVRRFQHGIGFPYARIGAKEYFQLSLKLASFFRLHTFEERIWIGTDLGHGALKPA